MASVNLVDSYEWKDGSPFSWTEAKASYGWNGYPTYNDAVENTETKKKNTQCEKKSSTPNLPKTIKV